MQDPPEGNGRDTWRWQGTVDARLTEIDRRFTSVDNGMRDSAVGISKCHEELAALRAELAVIRTKVAFWSGLGGLVGAGVVSAIVAVATQLG